MTGPADLLEPEYFAHLATHRKGYRADCPTCRDLNARLFEACGGWGGVYRFSGTGDCAFCNAALLWFRTPAGKQLPVTREAFLERHPQFAEKNALRGAWTTPRRGKEVLLPFAHWSTCPEAEKARRSS